MNILTGLNRFLEFINNNWTSIVILIGLIITIIKKVNDYIGKTDEEKIEFAKTCIKECILKMVTDAECDYEDWNKAGSIKRSQVITTIYKQYPILSKIVDQESLINWIDEQIDNALVTLRDVIASNQTDNETKG